MMGVSSGLYATIKKYRACRCHNWLCTSSSLSTWTTAHNGAKLIVSYGWFIVLDCRLLLVPPDIGVSSGHPNKDCYWFPDRCNIRGLLVRRLGRGPVSP